MNKGNLIDLRDYIPFEGLDELPLDVESERSFEGRRILSPGEGFVTDWVNRYTLSLFPFTIGINAERILPANPLRSYLVIQNKEVIGGNAILVNFGQNPTAFSSLRIEAGGSLIFEGGARGGGFSPQDDVYVLGTVAALDGVAGEGLLMPEII